MTMMKKLAVAAMLMSTMMFASACKKKQTKATDDKAMSGEMKKADESMAGDMKGGDMKPAGESMSGDMKGESMKKDDSMKKKDGM